MKDKLKKYSLSIFCGILCLAVLLSAAFYPREGEKEQETRRIVRIWNVDTFEGGKGSRTAFLKQAARECSKRREGVSYLVSSYTLEGLEEAFSAGKFPDVLSFGLGAAFFAERSLSLPRSFSGGEIGKDCFAYPWCRGGYALFSLTDEFEKEGKTAISVGGNNLPQVSAALEGISGEELPSSEAYVRFCSGEYRYLLGTQRDLCRFQARGVQVYFRALGKYCDLYQYLSVLSEENREDCFAFFETLLSKEGDLGEIGMFPLWGEDPFLSPAEWTVSAFSAAEALKALGMSARSGEKNLEKFLKRI